MDTQQKIMQIHTLYELITNKKAKSAKPEDLIMLYGILDQPCPPPTEKPSEEQTHTQANYEEIAGIKQDIEDLFKNQQQIDDALNNAENTIEELNAKIQNLERKPKPTKDFVLRQE